MSLSSRIVQRGVATIREVEEALARQVLYGGDLVTNLLEVCRVEEEALMPVIADELGLPVGPLGELPRASDEAKRLVAGEVALERALAPLSADAGGLVVAVAEPLDSDAEQELSFSLALPIKQQVAPLVRIRQALARDYGIPLERRFDRLLARITAAGRRQVSSFPPSRTMPEVKSPPSPPSDAPPPAPRPDSNLPRAEGTPETLVRAKRSTPPRPRKRRRGPLTFEGGTAELEMTTERDAIFDVLFEYARQFFDYTALFVVRGELAEGRDAWGQGAPREMVARIGVPLDLPSVLATAKRSKGTVRGRGDPAGVDGVLAKDLGRPGGTECVAIPVVVRTRVVALVFGDGGESGIDPNALAEVEKMTNLATAAFERLIVRRKLGGSGAPPPAAVVSQPPAVEELAAPIRELAVGRPPSSIPAKTVREPMPEFTIPVASPALSEGSFVTSASGNPPPPNVLIVRRPSGAPIPREEPEGASIATAPRSRPPRSRSSSSVRRATAPPLEFKSQPRSSSVFGEPVVPPTTRDPSPPDPPAAPSSPKAQSPVPPPPRPSSATDPSPGVMLPAQGRRLSIDVDELEPTPTAPPVGGAPDRPARVTSSLQLSAPASSKPMPQSEQVISVAAHRPPTSRSDSARGLPSVIVDVSSEYLAFVDRVLAGEDDEAEEELLRAGGHAMPAIMARFPGPVTIEPDRVVSGRILPRVGECGPVLRLIASQRRTALPSVLAVVGEKPFDRRFWATFLLTELAYPETLMPVVERAFDEDKRIRRVARAAARALAERQAEAVVERLAEVAEDGSAKPSRRVFAVEALGETRQPLAVTMLVPLLEDEAADVATAVRSALTTITRQDFSAVDEWKSWWTDNKDRHRIEWLIDALMHDHAAIRAVAGEELKTITKEYFGYYDDLPKRERERAQARYREWWASAGRVRFSRAAMRGN